MTASEIRQYSWTIGGYDIDWKDEASVSAWRPGKMVSTRLKKEVMDLMKECKILLCDSVSHVPESTFKIQLLLEEAGVNLWGHGKGGDPSKPSKIALEIKPLEEEAHLFTLCMQDDLDVFDIESLPDPTFDENLCEVTGRGILLIRNICKAKIRQIPLEDGGKLMEYEWRNPPYSLEELGFQTEAESD